QVRPGPQRLAGIARDRADVRAGATADPEPDVRRGHLEDVQLVDRDLGGRRLGGLTPPRQPVERYAFHLLGRIAGRPLEERADLVPERARDRIRVQLAPALAFARDGP